MKFCCLYVCICQVEGHLISLPVGEDAAPSVTTDQLVLDLRTSTCHVCLLFSISLLNRECGHIVFRDGSIEGYLRKHQRTGKGTNRRFFILEDNDSKKSTTLMRWGRVCALLVLCFLDLKLC